MLLYEQHNSTNPTGLTGPSPYVIPGEASEHIQPDNRVTMSYDRLRDQAFKTQYQSYVSRRIQPDMPNNSPKLHLAISSACPGLDMLVLPRQSCWEDSLAPPTIQFQSTRNVHHGCLFTTPGLDHLRRPPVHTCTKAWIQTDVPPRSEPSLTRRERSLLSSCILWLSLYIRAPLHVPQKAIPPKIHPCLLSCVLAPPGQRHPFMHVKLDRPAKLGFKQGCPAAPGLDTFARSLTLPVCQAPHAWMVPIQTRAAGHTGEVRVLARVSSGGQTGHLC